MIGRRCPSAQQPMLSSAWRGAEHWFIAVNSRHHVPLCALGRGHPNTRELHVTCMTIFKPDLAQALAQALTR
eukprot:12927549-Alexandrium_andersonii.AAC.1